MSVGQWIMLASVLIAIAFCIYTLYAVHTVGAPA